MREKLSARSFLAIRLTKPRRSRALVVWAANISESLPMAVSTARRIRIRRASVSGSRGSGLFWRSSVWRSRAWAAAGLQLLGDEALVADQQAPDLVVEVGNHLPFIDIGRGHREGNRQARQIDDQVAAKAVEMLLLARPVAPGRFAPEGPAPVAAAGATDRDRKAVENMKGVAGRKHAVQDPLLDRRQRRALPGEGLVGSEIRKEGPPMPVEVAVDGRVIVTALLFAKDFHGQDLDVGQLRVRAALPHSTAERHNPVGVVDQQIQQDERFFQAHGRLPNTPWTNLG